MTTTKCTICSADASAAFAHPGFKRGTSYQIYECRGCGASFADPLEVDALLYDEIYRQAEKLPGYGRYFDYASKAGTVASPINFLAETEDVYWAIRDFVRRHGAKDWKLLEIGSGLGYLTYALSKDGYKITGLEHSSEAVVAAKQRFGDLYLCSTVDKLVEQQEAFDAVISSEVIEHVPDAGEFAESLFRCVKPGGYLFLTTPNKSFWPTGTKWMTEAPPVHLWWLTEQSMSAIAKRLGAEAEFTDFTLYNKDHPSLRPTKPVTEVQYHSVLDEKGSLIESYSNPDPLAGLRSAALALRNSSLKHLAMPVMRAISNFQRKGDLTRRGTMGVVFRKAR